MAEKVSNSPRNNPSPSTFHVVFNGLVILCLDENEIRAVVPQVHDHIYGVMTGNSSQPGFAGEWRLASDAVEMQPSSTPQALGLTQDRALVYRADEIGFMQPNGLGTQAPHGCYAKISLPYPKSIAPARLIRATLGSRDGLERQFAAGACVLTYEIAHWSKLRFAGSTTLPSPEPNAGDSNYSDYYFYAIPPTDNDPEHDQEAFKTLVRFCPKLGWSLDSAELSCPEVTGLEHGPRDADAHHVRAVGGNCKVPMLVVTDFK